VQQFGSDSLWMKITVSSLIYKLSINETMVGPILDGKLWLVNIIGIQQYLQLFFFVVISEIIYVFMSTYYSDFACTKYFNVAFNCSIKWCIFPIGALYRHDIQTLIVLIGCGGMNWIDLAEDRDRWQALVNVVMNLQVP
jgi:hypothetical protein